MTGMCWICSHFSIRDTVKWGETKLLVKTYLDVKILTTDKISQTWFLLGFRVRAIRVKGKVKRITLNEKSPFLLSANSAVYTKKYQLQINIYYIEIGYYFKTFVWGWYFVLKVVNLVKAFTGAVKTCVGEVLSMSENGSDCSVGAMLNTTKWSPIHAQFKVGFVFKGTPWWNGGTLV